MAQELSMDTTLAAIVLKQPERAKVLERFGLDYCCLGKMSLNEACTRNGINARTVLEALDEFDMLAEHSAAANTEPNFAAMSMSEQAQNICDTHHEYMKEEMPRLAQLAAKVAARHGQNRPELIKLADMFAAFKEQMLLHMMKEEQILFPMIQQLENATSLPLFHCGSLSNPIRMMEFEHDQAGAMFETINKLTQGYKLPSDACGSYRALFTGLSKMERDLHNHVHKENNILFPSAQAAELKDRPASRQIVNSPPDC